MARSRVVLLVVLAALLAVGCSEGGSAGTVDLTEDTFTPDAAQDTEPEIFFGCNTVEDCAGKEIPGSCKKVACIDSKCEIVGAEDGVLCDDNQLCTENDQCYLGDCKGTVKTCSDSNICTDDACDPTTGQCAFTPNTAPCDDSKPCTQGEACSNGECTGGTSICDPCASDADCEKQDDGNKCNGVLMCVNQQCVDAPNSAVNCATMPEVACKTPSCDPATGQCIYIENADGSDCNDANACTKEDKCDKGVCRGTPLTCNDGNDCTLDSCDADKGCQTTKAADGLECEDNDLCTSDDACVDGQCKGLDVCACTTNEDCIPFEDGNLCNGTLQCVSGKCIVNADTVVPCNAGTDPCKTNTCDPTTGKCEQKLALDGTSCEDKNACTQNDYCSQGTCVGLPVNCNDNKACTADSCEPLTGCVNAPKEGSCGDGDPCTTNDRCVNGECMGDPDPTCGPCETDADCANDTDLCNGTIKCTAGKCKLDPATVTDCKGVAVGTCETATCEPSTGACIVSPVADATECDDLNACTKNDKCQAGTCKGQNIVCDDSNICTSDGCSSAIGCVYTYNTNACDDKDACTVNDICSQGTCKGTQTTECACTTDDECDFRNDDDLCNGAYRCIGYKCQIAPATVVVCDTQNDTECSSTLCNPTTGECEAVFTADGKSCDDFDACTTDDACSQGLCVGSGTLTCDDGDDCTLDGCNEFVGCIVDEYLSDTPCDDGDACTDGDTCSFGSCVPGDSICGTCEPDWTLNCGGTDTYDNSWSGSTDFITAYPCEGFSTYDGPEYTYTFTSPATGTVTVTLTEEDGGTEIFVLESLGQGCEPKNCLTYGLSSATFQAVAGATYYLVVDGDESYGLPGSGYYTITLTCGTSTFESDCTDGEDNDMDGYLDCDDFDCAGDDACYEPECVADWSLYCGESDTWATYNSGATDVIDTYSCTPYFTYPGREYTYVFNAETSGPVTFELTDETADLDVMVLTADASGTCLASLCLDSGLSSVTIDAVAGQTYFVVVDGYNGEEGEYTITTSCAQ